MAGGSAESLPVSGGTPAPQWSPGLMAGEVGAGRRRTGRNGAGLMAGKPNVERPGLMAAEGEAPA
ncbi:hypothetical protein [Candidatus Neomicrothrix sp.]|uniref:hypothetical protein n=1 Tax=Candidatus Neomicrothrix sp. TaxID=2719034 RepID=UPI003CD0D3BB